MENAYIAEIDMDGLLGCLFASHRMNQTVRRQNDLQWAYLMF